MNTHIEQNSELHPVSAFCKTGVSWLPPENRMHEKQITRMQLFAAQGIALPEFNEDRSWILGRDSHIE